MRLAAVTARTAMSARSFRTTSPSLRSAKESEPTPWTQPTPKRSGRKVKKWSERRFSRYDVTPKPNHPKGSADRRKDPMTKQTKLGGTFTLPNSAISLHRMGYGAMQLAGPGVWGPPRDVDAAISVLREAVASGVNHIDTSDFYGPHVTNQLIKQALHPYPDDLVIVTKVGAKRGEGGSLSP